MRLLESWVGTPLAAALGWTLLHSLWEGGIVAAALAAALLVVRPAHLRYAAACLAMLLMLGAFGITLVRTMPDATQVRQTIRPAAFPPWNVSRRPAATPAETGLGAAVPWLAPFWMAGVWTFYLAQLAGWISLRRIGHRGVCSASGYWQKELSRLRALLRVARPVVLLESCLADTPMVLGHLRPWILMPVGLLAGLPAEQVEAILLHELAHIRRCDYLVNVLQRAVEGLLFYHPAAWWIGRVMRAERENCCDDVVVAWSGDAHTYAVALAALEENRCSGREAAVAASGGNLMTRIRRLLIPQQPNGAWTPVFAAVILILTAGIALYAWQTGEPQQSSAAAQTPGSAAASPYDKWLNEDVLYIIADAERAAFLRLTTDDERQKFIEQFWLRRDPTPGTVENEFKVEHYRRIAYANSRFGTTSGTAGWQTDRGHVYIVYGPPDELENHPRGTSAQYPSSVWLYHHVDGIGDNVTVTFVDRAGTGDYRLAPGNGK